MRDELSTNFRILPHARECANAQKQSHFNEYTPRRLSSPIN